MCRRASRRIVALKPPAETAIRGRDDQQMTSSLPVPARSGGALACRVDRPRERAEHPLHALGIRPRGLRLLLRAAQARGGDHLHRRGDLLRRADAADADPQFLEVGHDAAPALVVRRRSWRSRRGSRVSFFSVSAVISRLVADRRQDLGLLARSSPSIAVSKRVTPSLDLVEIAARAGEDRDDLLFDRHRRELRLLQQLGQARAAREQALRRGIEIRGELREGRHLAILRELQLDLAGDLLHRLDLRRRADAAHREADIDGRTDAAIEQFGLEEDLAVGDRDHVGRDIGRDVAGLRLDDRQRGQRARAVLARSSSPRARAGVNADRRRRRDRLRGRAGGAAAATSGDRRPPASTDRHRRSAACMPLSRKIFAHGAAGIGRQELQRRRLGRGRGDDDRVFERAVILQRLDDLRDGRALLADGDIDAIELLDLVAACVDRPSD